jgi:rhodanese-related sulfurtransferase
MNKYRVFALFILLLSLLTIIAGCDYITGQAPENTSTTASLPRWVWDGFADGYPIVVDRNTGEPLRDITPDEAFGIIGSSQILDYPVIIDVRTPQEYAGGHIRSAINIDLNSPDFNAEIGKLDKNKTCIVYCSSGARSNTARNIMEASGFRHILNMTGGITEWISLGFPTVKSVSVN